MVVPKIIHQIWIGPNPRPEHWMRTWREMNPSFQYELWDNERCKSFDFSNAKKIEESPELCGKADIMRYEILERFGGIFIDADSECIKPLDDELLQHDNFACYENELARPRLIANGYLGAVKGSELMRILIEGLRNRDVRALRAWLTTGPVYLTQVNMLYPELLHIFPSHYFIPKHYSGVEYAGDGPIYAKQYWGSTVGYGHA